MHGLFLADLSTLIWVIVTSSLFVLLAHWSTGESWGLTASIVRGVRGWAEHDRPAPTVSSPYFEPLAPLLVSRRPIGGAAARRLTAGAAQSGTETVSAVEADRRVEVVDLGERRLRR